MRLKYRKKVGRGGTEFEEQWERQKWKLAWKYANKEEGVVQQTDNQDT